MNAPGVKVTFHDAPSHQLIEKLGNGELDMAIIYEVAGKALPNLRVHHLLRERFVVALPPNHPLSTQQSVRLADLAEENWVAALPDGVIVRACRESGFEPNLVSITSDQLAICALVLRDLAVTLVPELLAAPFHDLALRAIADVDVARDVYAVLPAGHPHPLVPAMLDALEMAIAGLGSGPRNKALADSSATSESPTDSAAFSE